MQVSNLEFYLNVTYTFSCHGYMYLKGVALSATIDEFRNIVAKRIFSDKDSIIIQLEDGIELTKDIKHYNLKNGTKLNIKMK